MCDSPYHACRFSITNRGDAARSSMAHPHIGLAHFRIVRDRLIISLGKHAPAREHGDLVRKVRDDAEIVLDHQHRAVGRHRLDELGDALDILVPHAGGRLVKQEHFRIERERGGDLKRTLAPVGKLDRRPTGERRQADVVEQRLCALRSEEHTSELQSLAYLVCRLLLEKKKKKKIKRILKKKKKKKKKKTKKKKKK